MLYQKKNLNVMINHIINPFIRSKIHLLIY